MSRFADYFVVVGYDYEKGRNGQKGGGKILQRFPEKDWDGCPFTQGIELFCQPSGWSLSLQKHEPTFFVSTLTDIDADRHYCACLTFSEDVVAMEPLREDDEETDQELIPSAYSRNAKMYAPKSLVLVSRLDYFDAFRNCLGIIYAVHVDNLNAGFETIIGNILGCVQVPAPGGPQIRFSIGADDRQALQPPMSSTLPVTRVTVALLINQLGIMNTLTVFCAALSDHKVLFHSQSYSRLTDAGHALTALMYPLRYCYVYIPLLPIGLLEVLNTPTPFIAGVHTSLKPELSELLDVVVADLDGGSVKLPENVHIALMPEPILSHTLQCLQLILRPELIQSDLAFPPPPPRTQTHEMLDKEVRAVFLRMFAELFFGYRSCLTIIRIHPDPVITFHKANFLGHRGLIEDDFITRVLDSMSFSSFVYERGPPYRVCDVFDEVFSNIQETRKSEENNRDRLLHNIRELAQQLHQNENPTSQPYVQKIPRPTEGAHMRIHQPVFPHINTQRVSEIVEEGVAKQNVKTKQSPVWHHYPRIVPMGSHVSLADDRLHLFQTNARRLEVLQNCVGFIFENKIADARKIFPAVLRALKSKVARLALIEELNQHVNTNRAVLDHQQFDLVVRLLNCALQTDSCMDEYGVAAAILPLATAFCRKLFTGVIQFAYTCIQEHAVWTNLQFWETAFYLDVQQQILQLYLPQHNSSSSSSSAQPSSPKEIKDSNSLWSKESTPQRSDPRRWSSVAPRTRGQGITALEIAAEQLRIWPNQTEENRSEMISNEESTVYSQAIQYAYRMVYLRIPLDANKKVRDPVTGMEGESLSSVVTTSVAESDSYDAESGFEEQEVSEVGTNVTKFVTRFVDKACAESGVSADHIKSLHQMIPGVIAMHLETLEAVYQESKRLPPIQKPKILTPTLLPGEEIIMAGLRVYLIPDGREEGTGGNVGGPILLPAEGAIFLTTYRIIFKGTPCDPLACEQIVCRSFPISSLTKEKKLGAQCLTHVNQWLQEAVQLRSSTFQLMKMAFDEEVNLDDVEMLRKLIIKFRNPPAVTMTFAFSGGHVMTQPLQLHKAKEKNVSLKSFAKRTLRKAGLTSKETSKRPQKYAVPTPPMGRRALSGTDQLGSLRHEAAPMFDDDLSVIDEQEIQMQIQNDARNIDRLAERPYCRDYNRLGLGSLTFNQTRPRSDGYRLTMVNTSYSVCQSYPAVLVVPQSVSDDSVQKFARSHRQNRFPTVTWRHPVTKAVLLRGSGFHGKGVMGMLKGHYNTPAGGHGASGSEGTTSTTLEQEKYFSSIVTTTPLVGAALLADSSPSLFSGRRDSSASLSSVGSAPMRKDPSFTRVLGGLMEPAMALGRMSVRDSRRPASAAPSHHHTDNLGGLKQNGTAEFVSGFGVDGSIQGLRRAALYVLGEKTQLKGIRLESFNKCDFIPVDYCEVRHVKSSFKKLMRACLPSITFNDPEAKKKGFLKAVEESDWLTQLSSILQIAGAAVDLLDFQGSSVMICLEDGWDFTTQVISVAQILLDPFYRTFEGFRVLVEKEWLSFGYRFTHRSNQTVETQASGFAPIFLQFLDVVHQIHSQFPLSFEFNQYYIKFLAYHHVSNRFRTFMLDTERARMEAGWLLEEGKSNVTTDKDGDPVMSTSQRVAAGMTVWEYIDVYHKKSPLFYNFYYSANTAREPVLRPFSNVSNLKIWDYYLTEDLAHGPSYDFEVIAMDLKSEAEQEQVDGPSSPSGRKIVNACYDNVAQVEQEACSHLLQEIQRLETELGGASPPTRTWKQAWNAIESSTQEQIASAASTLSLDTRMIRQHGRSAHKRSTLELLVKGKMLGDSAGSKILSQAHHFERFNYTMPTSCEHCQEVLWGFSKTGMHCTECDYNCHDKCAPHVPKNCSKVLPSSEFSGSNAHIADGGGTASETTSTLTGESSGKDGGEAYLPFASSMVEHRSYEGYLWKRGALLKGWKQRWFVIDSMKHELRYYDTRDDPVCKDDIDLKDVVSVQAIKNVQGAPKKADENAFFELKTMKRTYHFLASDAKAAQEWLDKLQNCICP